MFKIDTNQVIRMNKEDDVKFSLFINKGNSFEPERYVFKPDQGCEVYFFIYDYNTLENHPWDHIDSDGYNPNTSSSFEPILSKSYCDDGTVKTKIYGEDQPDITDVPNIDDDGNMIIWISSSDTENIPQGSYVYQIKAKTIDSDYEPEEDPQTGELIYHYVYNSVTNRIPIYIIDDNYSYREW